MSGERGVTNAVIQPGRRSALVIGALSATALFAGLGGVARAQKGGAVKLTLLITPPKDPDAFTKYYLATHIPLVGKVPGVTRTDVATVLPPPPGQPASPYYRITEIYFENVGAMQTSLASPEWKAVVADVPNFADPSTITGFASRVGV
ncbi:MAG: EthD family reductase [Acetobacteraceae bacterium]|jgi:uncharacterized protein (TIGR02118 family)